MPTSDRRAIFFYFFLWNATQKMQGSVAGMQKVDLTRRHLLRSIPRGKVQAGLAKIDRSPLSYYSYRTIMVRGTVIDDVDSYPTQLPNLVLKKNLLLSVGR